jgi:hypothetical protein
VNADSRGSTTRDADSRGSIERDADLHGSTRIISSAKTILFAVCIVPFIILATLNSAGYRYGASDQAFYLPAILERLNPELFPHDSALIRSQARLTLVDETTAALARATGLSLPTLFAVLYVVALCLLAWGALSIARQLYTTRAAAVALLFALTLRHAITKSGTNTLEGYFHPRQLAFGLGVIAVAAYLKSGISWRALLPVAVAALLHPTTALWFVVWLGVAIFVSERRLRIPVTVAAAAAAVAAAWALAAGPLEGRFARMDDQWLATLAGKDYLFPLHWPLSAWVVNLGYIPLIAWIHTERRKIGALVDRERAMAIGCLSLAGVFVCALVLQAARIAIAIQLQPARIFWMLDFLATVYAVWLLAEWRPGRARRAAIAAAIVLALTVARGGYVAFVRFPERPFAQIGIPDNDWGRVMAWARASQNTGGWLADPYHAALYGTSVRVAGERDVFVEAIKDAAIGMYDRPVAIRTDTRMRELGGFAALTPARARDLGSKYDLDYVVTERELDLPVAFSSGLLRVYRLR